LQYITFNVLTIKVNAKHTHTQAVDLEQTQRNRGNSRPSELNITQILQPSYISHHKKKRLTLL